jgi:fibronectin-binding autotransporter adhesin
MSGQAFAANYFSNVSVLVDADLAAGALSKWATSTGGCTTGLTNVATLPTIGVNDTFTICNGHTLTISSTTALPTTLPVAAITVNEGTLAITGTGKLTLPGGVATTSGSITVATGGELAAHTLTTLGINGVNGTGKITLSVALDIGAGTVVTIGAGGILTASGTLKGTLAIPVTSILGGNFTFSGSGTLAPGSVLKLAPTGNHTITAVATGSTIPSLNLAGATGNKTITSATGNLTLSAVTFPTAPSTVIIFSAGSGTVISVPVPAANVATCVMGGVTAAPASAPTVGVGTPMVCTTATTSGSPVNASVDLRESGKVTTTSEEISIK